MADEVRVALADLLRKAGAEPGLDVLREGVRVLAQALMELEVEQHLGRGATSGPRSAPATATATGSGPGTRGWARSS